MKEFADNNFKCDENGRRFSKWVEKTVGKGEILRIEQFLLSYNVFKTLILQTHKNQGLFRKGLKIVICNSFTLDESKICHLERDNTQNGCRL